MNTQHPHQQPLDADEREFARVVRALPGGGPPPALDARILKAAQDAVASAPQRRRRPWAALGSAWGASSAAAAVLALGVGWQLLNPPRSMQTAGEISPAPVAAIADKQHSTEVDFIQREPPAMTVPPPPDAPASTPRPQSFATQSPRKEQLADAAPEPVLYEHVMDEHVANVSPPAQAEAAGAAMEARQADQNRRDQSAGSESYAAVGAMAKASATAPPPPVASQAPAAPLFQAHDTSAGMIDSIVVSGTRIESPQQPARSRAIAQSGPAERERIASDATLSRDDWIQRIRRRMRDGDLAGAHASLVLFLEKHPGNHDTLPTDIRRLLHK